jgi:hypothetical protein
MGKKVWPSESDMFAEASGELLSHSLELYRGMLLAHMTYLNYSRTLGKKGG